VTVQRFVLGFAGGVVLVSTLLAWLVSPLFLIATGFVGANLLQSSFTRWCLLAQILRRAGLRDEGTTWA
jgi:hypothetical protein